MFKGGRQQFKQTKSVRKNSLTHKAPAPHRSPQAILQRAQMQPSSLTSQDIIQLQRTIGNRAVQRLLAQQRQTNPTPHSNPIQRQQSGAISSRPTRTSKGDAPLIQRRWWWEKKKQNPFGRHINPSDIGDVGETEVDTTNLDQQENIPQHGIEGDDPVNDLDITNPNRSKDLLYGLAWNRSRTHSRMTAQDPAEDGRIRTIDNYNEQVGMDGMFMTHNNAIQNLYKVRQALHAPHQWKTYLPKSQHNYPTGRPGQRMTDAQKWMVFLVYNKHKIGLMDLGDKAKKRFWSDSRGLNKINSKKRWEKNQSGNFQYKKIRSKDVYQMLGFGLDGERATKKLNKWHYTKILAANKWVSNAFWRRTSKLGIDFTLSQYGLNADIHFNLASGKKIDIGQWEPVHWGIEDDVERDEGSRKITESEYRHAKRLIDENPDLEDRIHFYSEY